MPMGSREVGPGGGGCEGQQGHADRSSTAEARAVLRGSRRGSKNIDGLRLSIRFFILVFRRSTVEPGGLVKVFDIDNDSIFPFQVRRRSEVFK